MQKNLNQTCKLLSSTEEELKKCRYALKERDFVISEQRKAGMFDIFVGLLWFSSGCNVTTLQILKQRMLWLNKHAFYGLTWRKLFKIIFLCSKRLVYFLIC